MGPGRRAGQGLLIALCLVVIAVLLLPSGGAARPGPVPGVGGRALTLAARPASGPLNLLSLSANTQPSSICALSTPSCAAATTEARVQLTATAPAPYLTWPDVQVAFVIETTAYDGVYDPQDAAYEKDPGAGYDPCATAHTGNALCEESNGVPFFVSHAGSIASAIQAANPHSNVSFAMVDYQGATGNWYFDDNWGAMSGDQIVYHVDSATFQPAAQFATVVRDSFQLQMLGGGYVLPDEDLADAFLHSASIPALYGTIQGSGLDWSPNTHHVIVWIGSTAPEVPSFPENYCVSPSGMLIDDWPNCYGSVCAPSIAFPTGIMPNCEGWVYSQDGNPNDSIAGLAHSSPNCVDSVGKVCTIDMIDLWDTPTDPYSAGWPTGLAYKFPGPGTPTVIEDADNILLAGCDLAAATGGTWDGPSYFSCPDGQSGTLQYVNHGPPRSPDTSNPTLQAALDQIGFGAVPHTEVGQGTHQPIFSFVPFGNIAVASSPEYSASCHAPSGFTATCPQAPSIMTFGNTAAYGWNWSTDPASNVLYTGDTWTASFYVVDTGPPYRNVPVDACTTPDCYAAGSGPVLGMFSWATYFLPNTTQVETQTFPLTTVTVSETGPPVAVVPPPPPLPPPPALPVLAPISSPIPQPIALPIQSPVGTVSIQATAAGLLMAGITRVMLKNKPIAMQMAMKNGPAQSQFDKNNGPSGPDVGRFE